MTETFVQVPLSLLDAQGICQTAKIVYQRLMSHLNRKTGQCNPKFRTLAKELGLSYSTIQRAIKALRNNGLIRTIRTRASSAFELVGLSPRPVKNDHSRSVTDDHSRSVKNERSDAAPSLLTEPDEIELEVGPAAAVNASESIGPLKNGKPAAAADTPPFVSDNPKPNAAAPAADRPLSNAGGMNIPKTETPAVREPQINFAGLARAIGESLIAAHPTPGLPERVFSLIEAILRNAPNPEATGELLWNNHASFVRYWKTCPPGTMIPQLWRWVRDDWKYPAPERKPPKTADEIKRDSFIAYRQKYGALGGRR